MSRNPPLRVVVVGREVSIAPVEQAVLGEGASAYICVPTLEAADWLIRDGVGADLLIVHEALLPASSDLLALRRRVPGAVVLPIPALCDKGVVGDALMAARRRRDEAGAMGACFAPGCASGAADASRWLDAALAVQPARKDLRSAA